MSKMESLKRQVKATLALSKLSLKSMTRNPSSVVFSIVFPLIFILIFGLLGGNGGQYEVFLKDGADKESPIYLALDEIESIEFVDYDDSDEALEELKSGNLDGILDIDSETTEMGIPQYNTRLTTSEAAPESAAVLGSILQGINDSINLQAVPSENLISNYESESVSGRKYTQIDFVLPGQLGFALLSSGVFGTAFLLMSLKETLVLKRFFATPIKKGNILLAEGLSRLAFSIVQAFIIIGAGYFFFDFTLINGFYTFFQMLALSALGLVVFLGMGFFVSSVAKDQNGIPSIANLFTLPQFLMAGTFFPIEFFPTWLQPISRALPLTYLNDAMRMVAFEGAGFRDILTQIAMLLVWIVIIYSATARVFKWEKQ